jgi:hypothetical protein
MRVACSCSFRVTVLWLAQAHEEYDLVESVRARQLTALLLNKLEAYVHQLVEHGTLVPQHGPQPCSFVELLLTDQPSSLPARAECA